MQSPVFLGSGRALRPSSPKLLPPSQTVAMALLTRKASARACRVGRSHCQASCHHPTPSILHIATSDLLPPWLIPMSLTAIPFQCKDIQQFTANAQHKKRQKTAQISKNENRIRECGFNPKSASKFCPEASPAENMVTVPLGPPLPPSDSTKQIHKLPTWSEVQIQKKH